MNSWQCEDDPVRIWLCSSTETGSKRRSYGGINSSVCVLPHSHKFDINFCINLHTVFFDEELKVQKSVPRILYLFKKKKGRRRMFACRYLIFSERYLRNQ